LGDGLRVGGLAHEGSPTIACSGELLHHHHAIMIAILIRAPQPPLLNMAIQTSSLSLSNMKSGM